MIIFVLTCIIRIRSRQTNEPQGTITAWNQNHFLWIFSFYFIHLRNGASCQKRGMLYSIKVKWVQNLRDFICLFSKRTVGARELSLLFNPCILIAISDFTSVCPHFSALMSHFSVALISAVVSQNETNKSCLVYICRGGSRAFRGRVPMSKIIQLWTFAIIRLLNSPYENEVTSKEHNWS